VVAAQVDLALKGAQALVARVGLVAGVLAGVRDQVRGLAEGLAAHGALVRLLARVNIGVLLHVRLLVEALVAVGAGVGPGVRVDEQVGGQCGGALEGLAALSAEERALLARVSCVCGTSCISGASAVSGGATLAALNALDALLSLASRPLARSNPGFLPPQTARRATPSRPAGHAHHVEQARVFGLAEDCLGLRVGALWVNSGSHAPLEQQTCGTVRRRRWTRAEVASKRVGVAPELLSRRQFGRTRPAQTRVGVAGGKRPRRLEAGREGVLLVALGHGGGGGHLEEVAGEGRLVHGGRRLLLLLGEGGELLLALGQVLRGQTVVLLLLHRGQAVAEPFAQEALLEEVLRLVGRRPSWRRARRPASEGLWAERRLSRGHSALEQQVWVGEGGGLLLLLVEQGERVAEWRRGGQGGERGQLLVMLLGRVVARRLVGGAQRVGGALEQRLLLLEVLLLLQVSARRAQRVCAEGARRRQRASVFGGELELLLQLELLLLLMLLLLLGEKLSRQPQCCLETARRRTARHAHSTRARWPAAGRLACGWLGPDERQSREAEVACGRGTVRARGHGQVGHGGQLRPATLIGAAAGPPLGWHPLDCVWLTGGLVSGSAWGSPVCV